MGGVQTIRPRARNGAGLRDAQDLNRVRRGLGTLRVNTVYGAIQGEGVNTGVPMVLLRLQGCSVGCPFCEGSEESTPPEVAALREPGSAPNGPGWRVRVIPNKFPALEIEGDLNKRGDGIYDMMRGVGAHEVIIETPRHLVSTSELSEEQLREVFWVYRDRRKRRWFLHGRVE